MRLDYKWQVAIIGALGLFMAVLDNTIVSVALPQMQLAFKTDFSTITWVAGLLPGAGRRHPHRGLPER